MIIRRLTILRILSGYKCMPLCSSECLSMLKILVLNSSEKPRLIACNRLHCKGCHRLISSSITMEQKMISKQRVQRTRDLSTVLPNERLLSCQQQLVTIGYCLLDSVYWTLKSGSQRQTFLNRYLPPNNDRTENVWIKGFNLSSDQHLKVVKTVEPV